MARTRATIRKIDCYYQNVAWELEAQFCLPWPPRWAAETTEVSLKGCCVSTVIPLDRGTIVRLKIERREQTVEMWARGAGATIANETGFAFLGTKHQEVLARWMSAEGQT